MSDRVVQQLSLARIQDSPGYVKATVAYDIPSGVVNLRATIPGDTEVHGFDGFRNRGGGQFVWDSRTDVPVFELSIPVGNQSMFGGVSKIDTGSWAIITTPTIHTQWTARGRAVQLERKVSLDDRGVASSDGALVYLGPYEEYSRSAGGQFIRLIIPEAADVAESPRQILNAIAYAAGVLQVGSQNDEVVGIAAPTRPVNWGPGGLQAGANGFWVRDSAKLDKPNNSWIHEYLHTRQEFGTTPETKWLTEASAVYYATRLTYQQGLISEAMYYSALNTDRCETDVLAKPRTWSSAHVPYQKGSRVLAWLDNRMREMANTSFTDVFAELNSISKSTTNPAVAMLSNPGMLSGITNPVSHDRLLGLLADQLGERRHGTRFSSLENELNSVVHSPDAPREFPPAGLETRPPGELPDPYLAGDLSDMLEDAFGEEFYEELTASDGRFDEDVAFNSHRDAGPLARSELFSGDMPLDLHVTQGDSIAREELMGDSDTESPETSVSEQADRYTGSNVFHYNQKWIEGLINGELGVTMTNGTMIDEVVTVGACEGLPRSGSCPFCGNGVDGASERRCQDCGWLLQMNQTV